VSNIAHYFLVMGESRGQKLHADARFVSMDVATPPHSHQATGMLTANLREVRQEHWPASFIFWTEQY
jgi:hypothetical protein